ncbi:LCP family protein [Tuberibacillus sp. Marseille-P3662]|uniref:LCP family protein n=1 Tax=Tuberibacillus sp. Marseille-P3662 TaxID=1965358 RepID=UPI000A1C9268|nr:LCP family protein [Tuberibacillus sp. Marseille-P3662]
MVSRQEFNRRNKVKRVIKSTVLTVLILILAGVSFAGYLINNTLNAASDSYNPIDRGGKSKYREEKVSIADEPFSILLMGVENYSSGGKNGRTDTLIALTINPKKKKAYMVSIPRDTRVDIAGADRKAKINSAHVFGSLNGYGGNKAAVETVENYLDIPIDYYAQVDFQGFIDIIKEINGVTVDVPFKFWEKDILHGNKKINFEKGKQHLNAAEALAYVRMRKRDPSGDFGRTERQRQVITAAVNKVKTSHMIFKIDDIGEIIGDNIETNLSVKEIYSLQKQFADMSNFDIQSLAFKMNEGIRIDSKWYYRPNEDNLEKIKRTLRNSLEIGDATSEEEMDSPNPSYNEK